MKLNVMDIPEDGMNVEATAKDVWLKALVQESFEEDFVKGSKARLDLHLIRTGKNVQVSGDAHVDLQPSCDRCLENFNRPVDVELHVNMAPKKDLYFEGDAEKELESDDVNFSFYEGEEIDLAQLLREIFLLEIPLQYLCSEDCKGLCPQCGKNLNQEKCSCKVKPVDPRFAVLKKLKL